MEVSVQRRFYLPGFIVRPTYCMLIKNVLEYFSSLWSFFEVGRLIFSCRLQGAELIFQKIIGVKYENHWCAEAYWAVFSSALSQDDTYYGTIKNADCLKP